MVNSNHASINFQKWESDYNKSLDYQKFKKKFELPDLEKKA